MYSAAVHSGIDSTRGLEIKPGIDDESKGILSRRVVFSLSGLAKQPGSGENTLVVAYAATLYAPDGPTNSQNNYAIVHGVTQNGRGSFDANKDTGIFIVPFSTLAKKEGELSTASRGWLKRHLLNHPFVFPQPAAGSSKVVNTLAPKRAS